MLPDGSAIGGGSIFTWFAMDVNGRLAMFLNNRFGPVPTCVQEIIGALEKLRDLGEFAWGESSKHPAFTVGGGGFSVDMYSRWLNKSTSRSDLTRELQEEFDHDGSNSDAAIPIERGMYLFFAVEGNTVGDDCPVGYDRPVEMGDYYRYLVPEVCSGINDFPEELRGTFARARSIDFSKDRLLKGEFVDVYFPEVFARII
ncbi:hypothetical protein [Stenotrophomonas maltophilia]|uniref:hypothetical protein n=1 Tax=Stenotrophomonas maltophilia TaxID=40324 RepID=UPI0039C27BB1